MTLTLSMDETLQGLTMSGTESEETNSTTFWWEGEVTDVDENGIATTRTKYVRIRMNDWDSGEQSPDDTLNPYAMMMGPMLGMIVITKMDKYGNVLETSGSEGMFSMGNPMVDDNRINKELTEMNTKWRPEFQVEVGETWHLHHSVSYGYPMTYHNNYTLREVKDGVAYIDVNSVMEPNSQAGPNWFGPTKLTQTLSGTQTGTIEVNMETGAAIRSTYHQDFSGTYDMEVDTTMLKAMSAGMPAEAMSEMGSMTQMQPVKGAPMSDKVKYVFEVQK